MTRRYCAQRGWLCATVQAFYGGRRHDLFGIADSIVLQPDRLLFVQNCSYGSLKAHRDEILSEGLIGRAQAMLRAGAFLELWEWRRKKIKRGGTNKGREWYLRREDIRLKGPGFWEGPFDLYPKAKR